MRLLPLFLSALLLASCAGKAPAPKASLSAADCPVLYAFAPGNYIMDIAAGAEVVLDPGVQEFPLFCSPQTARAHVNREMEAGSLAAGDWRIYRLEGNFEDLAQEADNGRYTLKRLASAVDWVTE
ncbi:MAG: SON protein [Desulfovibrio sp.]|jgi:hypothetical protein|nr:SON protein [Desulfovibrio sp.]